MKNKRNISRQIKNCEDGNLKQGAHYWLFALALIIVTIFAYYPAWHAGFIWDDDAYVTENPLLTAPDGLRRIWFSFDTPSQYFPLTYTAFYLEHAFWGLNPAGYHCVNILLHAANALLVWRLLARLRVPGAWLAAGVFALHPVQVESVAWVTECKNVLMVFFFLLTLLAWIRFTDEKTMHSWRFYTLALVFYALALSAKTTACTLPAVLLLILWLKKTSISWRRLAQVAPFVVLGIGMGLVTVWWERHHQGTQGKLFEIGPVDRVLIASRALWFYAAKLLWPANLIFSYPRWTISAVNPMAYGWVVATVVLGVVIWRVRRRTGRGVEVALIFFAATLSPVLGFIMLYTFAYSFVADHYQYLACLGPIALATAGIKLGLERIAKQRPILWPVFCAVLLLTLGVLTWRQCGMYKDVETLWRTTIARNPDSWLAYDNLGLALDRQGKVNEAIVQYQQVLKINPDSAETHYYTETHYNLGIALAQKGELDEAIAQYKKALEVNPNHTDAHNNLGMALALKGDMAGATAEYQKALEIDPGNAEAHVNMGLALANLGKTDEAIAHYQKALKIKPDIAEAHYDLGMALELKGEDDEAIAQYKQAVAMHPDLGVALNKLGEALLRKGNFDGAMACFEKISAMSTDPAVRWYDLGNDFLKNGNLDEAIACYRQALSLNPRSADADANLGVAFFQKGQDKEAIDSWQQALAINPSQTYVLNNLAWLLATSPDASLRNGAKALELAEHARQLTGGMDPMILRTLAAAQAETGQYSEASATARQSLQLATNQRNETLAATLRKEIELYDAGAPVRDVKP
jgi:tetratricopeptide (TPR) repeat protein